MPLKGVLGVEKTQHDKKHLLTISIFPFLPISKICSLAPSSDRDRKRSLIPRYQKWRENSNLRPGTAASIEALSEVPDDQIDDKDEELMAIEAMASEVETPSEASGGAR